MPSKKTQYIVVPAGGLIAAEDNPQQAQFFQSLQQFLFVFKQSV